MLLRMWCVVDGCSFVCCVSFFRLIGLLCVVSVFSNCIMCLIIWIDVFEFGVGWFMLGEELVDVLSGVVMIVFCIVKKVNVV